MQDPYAAVPQTRAPITAEDRAVLQKTAAVGGVAGLVFSGIGVCIFLGAGWSAVGNFRTGDVVGGVFVSFFALIGLVFAGVGLFLRKRTQADANATEKIVYTGTVTDKRRDASTVDANQGHGEQHTTTREIVVLDGTDFAVRFDLWNQVERGTRVELHCVRPGEPFRIARIG